MDAGPVDLVYYAMCAAPGAGSGVLLGLSSRLGASATVITSIAGAIGGIVGGMALASVPTLPPGQGNDALVLFLLLLVTALCGGLPAVMATRLFRPKVPEQTE